MQENNCQTFMLLYFLCKVVGKVAFKKSKCPSQKPNLHSTRSVFNVLLSYQITHYLLAPVTFLLRFPPHIRCAVKLRPWAE